MIEFQFPQVLSYIHINRKYMLDFKALCATADQVI
jgi:hypothetical protein